MAHLATRGDTLAHHATRTRAVAHLATRIDAMTRAGHDACAARHGAHFVTMLTSRVAASAVKT